MMLLYGWDVEVGRSVCSTFKTGAVWRERGAITLFFLLSFHHVTIA